MPRRRRLAIEAKVAPVETEAAVDVNVEPAGATDAQNGSSVPAQTTPLLVGATKKELDDLKDFRDKEDKKPYEVRMKDSKWKARKYCIECLKSKILEKDHTVEQIFEELKAEKEAKRVENIKEHVVPHLSCFANETFQVVVLALDLLACFAELAPLEMVKEVLREQRDLAKKIITKIMPSKRGVDRNAATQTIISLFFAECGEFVLPAVMKGLKEMIGKGVNDRIVDKKEKSVVATFQAITSSLQKYGVEYVPVDTHVMEQALQFAVFKNGSVRQAVKSLLKEFLASSGCRKKKNDSELSFRIRVQQELLGFNDEETMSDGLKKWLTTVLNEYGKEESSSVTARYKTRSKSDLGGDDDEFDNLLGDDEDADEEEKQEGEAFDLWENIRNKQIKTPKIKEVSAEEIKDKAGGVLKDTDFKIELLANVFFVSKGVPISKMCIEEIIDCIVPSTKAKSAAPENTETGNLLGNRLPPKPIIPGSADAVFDRLEGYLKKPNAQLNRSISNLIQVLVLGLQESFPQDKARKCAEFLLRSLATKKFVDHVGKALQVLFRKKRNLVKIFDFDLENCVAKLKAESSKIQYIIWLRQTLVRSELELDENEQFRRLIIKQGLKFCETTNNPAAVRTEAQKFVTEFLLDLRSGEVPGMMEYLPDDKKRNLMRKRDEVLKERKKNAKAKKKLKSEEKVEPQQNLQPGQTKNSEVSEVGAEGRTVSDDEGELNVTVDEAETMARQLYGLEENWSKISKTRNKGYKSILLALSAKTSMDKAEVGALIGVLSNSTGIDSERLGILMQLGQKCDSPLPRKSLEPIVHAILLERKVKTAEASLLCIGEATSPGWLLRVFVKAICEKPFALLVKELLLLACSIIESFGSPGVGMSEISQFLSSIFDNVTTHKDVCRTAYLKLVALIAAQFSDEIPEAILGHLPSMVEGVAENWEETIITGKDKEVPNPQLTFFRDFTVHVSENALRISLKGKVPEEWLDKFCSELANHDKKEPKTPTRKKRFAASVTKAPGPVQSTSKQKPKPKRNSNPRPAKPAKPAKPVKPVRPAGLEEGNATENPEPKRGTKPPKRMRRPKAKDIAKVSKASNGGKNGEIENNPNGLEEVSLSEKVTDSLGKPDDVKKTKEAKETVIDKLKELAKELDTYRYPVKVVSAVDLFKVLTTYSERKDKGKIHSAEGPLFKLLHEVLEQLVCLIRVPAKTEMKTIMSKLILKCLDTQTNVRNSAISLLKKYIQHIGLSYIRYPLFNEAEHALAPKYNQYHELVQEQLRIGIGQQTKTPTVVHLGAACIDWIFNIEESKRPNTGLRKHFEALFLKTSIYTIHREAIKTELEKEKPKETKKTRDKKLKLFNKLASEITIINESKTSPPLPGAVSRPSTPPNEKSTIKNSPPVPVTNTPRTPGVRPASMREQSSTDTGGLGSVRGRRVQSVAFGAPVVNESEGVIESELWLMGNDDRNARLNRYMEYRNKTMTEAGVPSGFTSGLYIENSSILQEDIRSCVSARFFEMLTVPTNYFDYYLKAIDELEKIRLKEPEKTVQVADALLRWAASRIEDSKSTKTVLLKVSKFICSICEVLVSSGEKLCDYEASALIPALCGKLDHSSDNVREAMVECLTCVRDVTPDDIVLIFFASCLEQQPLGKNGSEVISEQVCQLIDLKCSSGAGLPVGVLSCLANVTCGSREVAGLAGASCMARAHHHFGDDLWELVGYLTDEEAGIIEERLVQVNSTLESSRQTPSRPVTPNRFTTPTLQVIGDICPNDYRLSVAPEPEASVKTALNSVLTTATPAKTRPAFGRSQYSTENYDSYRSEELETRNITDVRSFVLEKLSSSSWREQEQGLSELYRDLQLNNSKLRSVPSQVVPELSRCFSEALDQIQGMRGSAEDMLILKRLLNAIMAYAREPQVIVLLKQEALESLLDDLLYSMVPDSVCGIDDWKQVRRGVNLVLLKVLEACPKNLLYKSLIHVLSSSIRNFGTAETEAQRSRLSSKCSFCINSIAKTAQNGFANCDVTSLLEVIGDFLKENPIGPENGKPSEQQALAFRLLKSLVDRLVDELSADIRQHLPFTKEEEKSQLVRYIDMILETRDEEANAASHSRRVHFGSPSTEPGAIGSGKDGGGGSGQVYLRRLKEIQHKYGIDANATPSNENPDSSVTDSTILESKSDSNQPSSSAPGAVRDAKAESISRAAALRERMARIRSGEL